MGQSLYGTRHVEVATGRGEFIWDSQNQPYLDFIAGHGAALFGHHHPRLVKALQQASENCWALGASMEVQSRKMFQARLEELFPGFESVFVNSGAEAVEAALKLAIAWCPQRHRILALRKSFHGRTMGALGLTFNPRYRRPWQKDLLEVEHKEPQELLESLDETVRAVFVEPLQGEGGMDMLGLDFSRELRRRCSQVGAVLVADEIQTGWGRCGHISLSRAWGMDPDILCFAKGVAGGLPMGVLLWRGEMGGFPSRGHGSTYGGNPLVCSVALEALNLAQEFLPQVPPKEEFFKSALASIDSPHIVGIKGKGLLLGVELTFPAASVVEALQEEKVLGLLSGTSVVRFLPPLITSNQSFTQAAKTLERVLAERKQG